VVGVLATTGSTPGRVGVDPTQGVTRTSVSVGAIVTQSGPLAADFAPYLDGVRAYLAEVDAHGGVHGRTVRLVASLDDMSVPTSNLSDARVLVSQDRVFAIVGVASPFFEAAALLARAGVPTFGYATANVWAGAPNLFAVGGSAIDEASIVPQVAYLARHLGARRVALLALGVPQSQAPCAAMRASLGADGVTVAFANLGVPVVGSDLATTVVQMQQRRVGLVVSCMDVNSNVLLARAMQLHGLRVASLWLDGYDRSILRADASVMSRVYLVVQHVPFELATSFPGLTTYMVAMARAGYGAERDSDVALAGWESASLFVAGLRAAGAHPTQQTVVAAINAIARDTGGGVAPPVDWRSAHRATANSGPSCVAIVTTRGLAGPDPRFALALGSGRDPWTCLAQGTGPPTVVRAPVGTPLG
jgi:ABC-type branched-subunit amino acid transport system substrate-binding protein